MNTALLYTVTFLRNFFYYIFFRRNSSHGFFIQIDGGEGAGKDTVIEKLKEKYPHVEFSREPGGTPYGEDIRAVMLNSKHARGANALTQMLLVTAGRSDHMNRKAEEAIVSGKHFISNRGSITTWAYQIGGQEGGIPLKKLFFHIHRAIHTNVSPDLYIVLEVDPKEGARRVALRKGEVNHYDERKADFHLRVMKGYRTFAKLFPFRVRFVDANKTREEVFNQVDAIVGPIVTKSVK